MNNIFYKDGSSSLEYSKIIKEGTCIWCHQQKSLLPVPNDKKVLEETDRLWYCCDCLKLSRLQFLPKLKKLEKLKTSNAQDPNTIDYYCLKASLEHIETLIKAFEIKNNE